MTDITKRANKRVAHHLDGERLDVAVLCEMRGQLGLGMVSMVVARRTTESYMKGRTAQELAHEGGLAAAFPAEACAVGLSPTRFLAFPSNGLTFKPPVLIVDRSSVAAEIVGRRGFAKRVDITFIDGSRVSVDVGPGQPLGRLVQGLASFT